MLFLTLKLEKRKVEDDEFTNNNFASFAPPRLCESQLE
jgi:hypothetical protein